MAAWSDADLQLFSVTNQASFLQHMTEIRRAAFQTAEPIKTFFENHFAPYLFGLSLRDSSYLPQILSRMRHQPTPLRAMAMAMISLYKEYLIHLPRVNISEISPLNERQVFLRMSLTTGCVCEIRTLWERFERAMMNINLFGNVHRLTTLKRQLRAYYESPDGSVLDPYAAIIDRFAKDHECRYMYHVRDSDDDDDYDVEEEEEEEESEEESEEEQEQEEVNDDELISRTCEAGRAISPTRRAPEGSLNLEVLLDGIFGKYYAPAFCVNTLNNFQPSQFMNPNYYPSFDHFLKESPDFDERIDRFFFDVWICREYRVCIGCELNISGRIMACKKCDMVYCAKCLVNMNEKDHVEPECRRCGHTSISHFGHYIKGGDEEETLLGKRDSPSNDPPSPSPQKKKE